MFKYQVHIWNKAKWKVINEERIGSWLQQTEHISGHLWHRYTMNSAQPLGTLGSVASMLAATFYKGQHDRNQKHWNIWLTERYIHHMQVLLVLSCPFIRQGTCICILNWTLCRAFCRSLFVLFLAVIVLSVIRFMVSDYPFSIFKLFWRISSVKCRIKLYHSYLNV
jgi:hypothetical protein